MRMSVDMRDAVRTELGLFLLAVQFLTRLPVPRDLPFSDDLLIRATKYYPLVGLLVGVIGAVVLVLAARWLPLPVAVLLSLAATLLATGAFHEDGLADAADGLWGGQTAVRRLEIMRDSRIGTYGAVSLGVVLALKVTLLTSFAPGVAGWLLLLGHALGRMASVHVIATTGYARETGAKFVVPSVTPDGYRLALSLSMAVLILGVLALGSGAVLLGFGLCILLGQGVRLVCRAKIGGYTGDCLGATQQLGELGIYLGAALWL